MPYVEIKAYPKDEETKKRLVEKINQDFLEIWGCSQEAISISIEEIIPSEWVEKVENKDIIDNKDKMFILSGEKKYK